MEEVLLCYGIMRSYHLLFCILYILPAISAVIDLHISGSYPSNFTITASGFDKTIVTEIERLSFNITDKIIKDCVNVYLGGRPDDAFIHGPTPWGNLYKVYGWAETYIVLKPISSRIVNIASSPQMLKQQKISSKKTTEIRLSQTVYNRFSTTWIAEPDLEVKRIIYHIDCDNFKMVYESSFGENGVKLKAMTMGLNLTDLTDYGSVNAELYATRVSIKTELIYQASLWGNAVLNYEKAFRGHHFYSPNLEDIMVDCGISNKLLVREVVDLGFYVDGKIVVRNNTNGFVMLMKNVEIRPL